MSGSMISSSRETDCHRVGKFRIHRMRNGDSVVPLGPPLAVADAILALSQAGTGKQKKLARAVTDLAKNAPCWRRAW